MSKKDTSKGEKKAKKEASTNETAFHEVSRRVLTWARAQGLKDADVLVDLQGVVTEFEAGHTIGSKKLAKVVTPTDDLLQRIRKDLTEAGRTVTHTEARFLVDSFYVMQKQRIRLNNQLKKAYAGGDDQPCKVLAWFFRNAELMENQVERALGEYSRSCYMGRWASSHVGIAGILSACLLAHIDMAKATTPGHITSFAGLDPRREWKKGQKRPWNAALKTCCWKIGQSFIKVQNKDEAVYGKLYKARLEKEKAKNEKKEYADQAARKLEKFNIAKNTTAYAHYSKGLLPPAHINQRAARWAVKIFLSHWWEAAYEFYHQEKPPFEPYPLAHLGHVHKIERPLFVDERPDWAMTYDEERRLFVEHVEELKSKKEEQDREAAEKRNKAAREEREAEESDEDVEEYSDADE